MKNKKDKLAGLAESIAKRNSEFINQISHGQLTAEDALATMAVLASNMATQMAPLATVMSGMVRQVTAVSEDRRKTATATTALASPRPSVSVAPTCTVSRT